MIDYISESYSPLVSVIIPAFNHDKYVEQSIRSIWGQVYRNIELIVVDDGSTDNTYEIISRLEKESPIVMRSIKKDNGGTCKALNTGLEQVNGEYVTILASDDRYLPNHIHDLVNIFLTHPDDNLGMVFGNAELIDESGIKMHRYQFNKNAASKQVYFEDFLLFRWHPQGSANMYRYDVLKEVGRFNEKYKDESLDLYLRISMRYSCLYINKTLSEYRVTLNQDNLNTVVACDSEFYIEIFTRYITKHKYYNNEIWRRYAWSILYKRIADNNYVLRNINSARKWYIKSLIMNPFQLQCYMLLFRTLLGKKIISTLQKIRNKIAIGMYL